MGVGAEVRVGRVTTPQMGRVTTLQMRTEAPQPGTYSKEILEAQRAEAEAIKEELLVTQVVKRSGGAGVQRPGGAAVARPACARK